MNSNNQNTQDYYNLPIDQTGNSFASLQILNNNENIQHTLTNNVGVSNTNLNALHINTINTSTSAPQNVTFEFYFHLSNEIQQQFQHPIYQDNSIQQQYFDTTQPTPQVYSNNNACDTASISINGTVSCEMQVMGNTGFQNFS
jgi:hypothetical protein